MADPKRHGCTNLRGFFQTVTERLPKKGQQCWYRGQADNKFKLLPSLYRLKKGTFEEHLTTEFSMKEHFERRKGMIGTPTMSSRIEEMFFLQHYGIKTRLLDWSENPLIALFFALQDHTKLLKLGATPASATVWVLNPYTWNKKSLAHISHPGFPLSYTNINVSLLCPPEQPPPAKLSQMHSDPLAVLGIANNPRIIAQSGTFVLFGKTIASLEVIFDDGTYPVGTLLAIDIPTMHVSAMLDNLQQIGFTESIAYPDIEGVAMEINREAGL